MELILGYNVQNGTAEMQKYFSHIPGTIDFEEMQADIELAQEELEKYVGEDVIQKAVDHYRSEAFERGLDESYEYADEADSGSGEEESGSGGLTLRATDLLYDELVYKTQMAVTLMGYREYALNNDATHTKTGRMARMDKDTDEWTEKLIDRDDWALQRKIQRAIDRLTKFVDDNQFTEWTGSDIYGQTRELLVWNATCFQKFHPIDYSQRLYMLMLPMIRSVQEEYIVPALGTARFNTLLALVKTNAVTTDADKLLYSMCGYPVCYMALGKAYKELPVQLFPESISKNFWNAGNGAAFIAFRDKISDATWKEGQRKFQILLAHLETLVAEETETPITDDTITTIPERMVATNKFVRV
jgi:hypothetical protein